MTPLPPTRYSLIARLVEPTDVAAWGEFTQTYEPAIYRYCRARGLQEADAADAVQNVLMAVHQVVSSWEPSGREGSFRAWLLETARRVCLTLLRERQAGSRGSGESRVLEQLRGVRKDCHHEPAAPIEAVAPTELGQSRGRSLLWNNHLRNPRRTLAMTILSLVGIAAVTFAWLTTDGPQNDTKPPSLNATQPGAETAEAQVTQISAVVKGADADLNTLTVTGRDGEKTYTLPRDVSIVVNGKPAILAGLRAGARITLSMFTEQNTPQQLVAVGPQFMGVIKGVDADKSSIVLADGSAFVVTKNANISIDGKSGKLADLPAGAFITLSWFADLKTARWT